MHIKLETVLSVLGVFTAVAYALGFLKSLYYFHAFGVDALVTLSPQGYLFESWFVVENLVFFVVLAWWLAVAPRQPLILWAVAVLYVLVPILSQYAFGVDWPVAQWLIHYRHTLLKFVPLGLVLVGSWWAARRKDSVSIKRWKDVVWPHGPLGMVLFWVVCAAWGISAAKHFGSFDASRALQNPSSHLARGTAYRKDNVVVGPGYVVAMTDEALLLWIPPPQWSFASGAAITVTGVPTKDIAEIRLEKPVEIQIGSMFF